MRRRHEMVVTNGVFAQVFENLLERYNFTIQEDSPTSYEVAIDPEMLGQIFEELILTSEDTETAGKSKRHDTGSHYTRRPIVHYLCRDSLAAWLEGQPPFAGKPNAPERVRQLLALDATEGIDEETRAALAQLLTPEEAVALLDRISDLRACDPAVGSGAFPMGLLHELVNITRLCATRAAGKDPVLGDRSWLYNTKKRIIERVIYGVDIQLQAVEICRLRLWLSLMVDYEMSVDPENCEPKSFQKAIKEIEPLPNLDFKIRRANSLVDYIHGERIDLRQLSNETGAGLALSKLSGAKLQFFNARTAASKRQLRLDIYDALTELAKIELTRARLDAAGLGLALDDQASARVAEIDHGLKEIAFISAQVRDARRMRAQAQEQALERIRSCFDDPDKPTFVWQLDFAEVFHREEHKAGDDLLPPKEPGKKTTFIARTGFDLVIGNPPFIRIQVLTKSNPELAAYYKHRYQAAAKGNYDLYVCFVERGLELLHQNGQLAFIQPHKFFNAQYGEPLRALLAKGKHIRHIVHFGDQQIFPGATNYVCLLFLAKVASSKCRFVKVDDLAAWLATYAGVEGDVPAEKIGASDWNFTVGKDAGLFERLQQMPVKLGDVADVFVGLQTSADDVFIMKYVSETARTIMLKSKALGRDWTFEKELLHPIVSGTDVSPYAPLPSRQFVLFPYQVENDQAAIIPIKKLSDSWPRTADYLKETKQRLEARESGKLKGTSKWHGYIYLKNMTRQNVQKVCVPRLVEYLHAAPDFHGTHYLDNVDVGGVTFKETAGKYRLGYLLALLNSSVLRWYFPHVAAPFRGGFRSANKQYLSLVPFHQLDMNKPVERLHHDTVVHLVDWLVWLKTQPSVAESTREHPRDPLIAAYFELWLNALVYELFFPAELHAAGLQFFDLTAQHTLPALSAWSEITERLSKIRDRYEQLSAGGHALRVALETLQTLDLVRIIEGKA
ncbi:MAG TPA: Eco57I restriction-modification methylase domain-containing protein [Candidatus Paceibacterota bacterium]|nr:Eco57I restriction-modification methylase domain-containing protein [Candidatus Paceibacterota bacterium]